MPALSKTIRRMTAAEKPLLESWRKQDKVVSDFLYVWERWKRWEDAPPVVAVVGKKPVGFHAVAYTKSGYINSVFQFVLLEHRGKRLAGAMIDYFLKEGRALGATRLRFRCPKDGPGNLCWRGFGVKPFGECPKEYWFDLTLTGVNCLADLIRLGPSLHKTPATDKRTLSWYRRAKVEAY